MEGRVSEKLHTLPSVNPTLALTCYQLTFIGLGAGEVRNCSDNNDNPQFITKKYGTHTNVGSKKKMRIPAPANFDFIFPYSITGLL